jgi:hypothetical protein
MLFVVLRVVVLIVTFTLTSRTSRELHELMDTEIVDYHGEAFSLQAFPPAPDSVLFSMHGNSSSSELQEMGVANGVRNTSQQNINLNMMQRTQPHRHPYHRSFSQPLTPWSGSIVSSEFF